MSRELNEPLANVGRPPLRNVDNINISEGKQGGEQYHELPLAIKEAVTESSNGGLTEGHLATVLGKVPTLEPLVTWADIDSWRITDLEAAIQKKWSSRQLADQWQKRSERFSHDYVVRRLRRDNPELAERLQDTLRVTVSVTL